MTSKQANEIIKNYKPHKGFFNLSEKPESLTKKEYATILDLQNELARQSKLFGTMHKEDRKLNDFGMAQDMSATLQQIIFKHWGLGVMEVEE